jgi:hypothetical protein
LDIFSPDEAHPPPGNRKNATPNSAAIIRVVVVVFIIIARQTSGAPLPAAIPRCNTHQDWIAGLVTAR